MTNLISTERTAKYLFDVKEWTAEDFEIAKKGLLNEGKLKTPSNRQSRHPMERVRTTEHKKITCK